MKRFSITAPWPSGSSSGETYCLLQSTIKPPKADMPAIKQSHQSLLPFYSEGIVPSPCLAKNHSDRFYQVSA